MVTQQRGNGRANALRGELGIHLEETTTAPAGIVYDRLADVRNHLEWGGKMQPKQNFRLLSVDAPEGPALVGTEFRSTGADAMGRFADSSVVTEATRPSVLEFVTEARLSIKKGEVVEWTNIHRYELTPQGEGCRISYTLRTVRISELPGALAMFRVPGLRSLALRMSGSFARKGLRNLVKLAEERAGARGKEER
ncbi:MAG: hypothetical protein WB297_09545 [Actinomycetota bacterium]